MLRLAITALLLLGALAAAPAASAVDLDCRQSPQLFCYDHHGRFCALYVNDSWIYACVGPGNPNDVWALVGATLP